MSDHRIDVRVMWLQIAVLSALSGGAARALGQQTDTASTQASTPSTMLQSFVGDARVKRSIEGVAAHSAVMVQSKCTEVLYAADSAVEILRPPTFDGSGNPTGGAWKQVVTETGCDDPHVLNVFVQVKSGGGIAAEPLLPGTTHVDPAAQKEALDKAIAVASEVPHSGDPNCHNGYVADTKLVEDKTDTRGSAAPEWKESWTLIACRRKFQVPMSFKLGDKGFHIFAGPTSLVRLIPLAGSDAIVNGSEFAQEPTQRSSH
jgi:hypothetical protein